MTQPRRTRQPGPTSSLEGFFRPRSTAFLTLPSESSARLSSETSLARKERAKRRKYNERVRPLGTFTPLVSSVYGKLGAEADKVLIMVAAKMKAQLFQLLKESGGMRIPLLPDKGRQFYYRHPDRAEPGSFPDWFYDKPAPVTK